MEKEITFLMCSLATGDMHVPSVKGRCAKCQVEVWVSHASQKLLQENNAVALCLECALQRMRNRNPDEIKFEGPSADQVSEILKSLSRDLEAHDNWCAFFEDEDCNCERGRAGRWQRGEFDA